MKKSFLVLFLLSFLTAGAQPAYRLKEMQREKLGLEGGKIAFKCVNSRQGEEQVRSHGVGLANVRGRLDLLYGDRYTLHIDQNAEVYDILLLLLTEAARA